MIFDNLFQLMAEKKASDIFITAGTPIHIKIQGHTMPINQQVMDPLMIQRMLHEAITPAQQSVLDRERELNLSFGRRDLGNFRVNVFWQRNSMAVVVRYIQSDIPSIGALGLPPVLDDIVLEKRGLVLVVGATGSGKSTTLAAMINDVNENEYGHILTVEDPIEFVHEAKKCLINQREVGPHTLSFSNALRSALREDPDIILVGEMRDLETISAALTAAETGHLVLATLHTTGGPETVDRIIDVFPPHQQQQVRMQLSTTLEGVLSQTLLRSTDGRSRVMAMEIMLGIPAISNLIREGKTHQMATIIQGGAQLGPGVAGALDSSLGHGHAPVGQPSRARWARSLTICRITSRLTAKEG